MRIMNFFLLGSLNLYQILNYMCYHFVNHTVINLVINLVINFWKINIIKS